jgi:hypothetical protein
LKHARTAMFGLFLIVVSGLVSATTIIPLSVEQLAGKSSQVLRGHATQSWTAWNPQHTLIYTYTKFQITKSLKGAPEQMVTVKQIGGRVGNTVQKVAGVRHFTPGEEDVLFLQPSKDHDGTMIVTGLTQGNFQLRRVDTGKVVASNGVPEVSSLEVGTGAISNYRGSAMTVDELESRIRKVVQQ